MPGIQRAGQAPPPQQYQQAPPQQYQQAPPQQYPPQQGYAPQQGYGQQQRAPPKPTFRLNQDFAITHGRKPDGRSGYNVTYFPTAQDGVVTVSATSYGRPGDKFASLKKDIQISQIEVEGTIVKIPIGTIAYDFGSPDMANAFVQWASNVRPRPPRQQGGGQQGRSSYQGDM